jgi:hypothetical protein
VAHFETRRHERHAALFFLAVHFCAGVVPPTLPVARVVELVDTQVSEIEMAFFPVLS